MTQSTVTPAIANTDEHTTEPATSVAPQGLNDTAFEEFDLDDIEIIESKVFA
ncbi:3-thiaglutamate biosynthesis pearlin carrier peptide TglA [Pseudomonas sp.]|uniref:3-thiaglutamate biosynthesis pearlin carrier peptide TglA n=1 Tax=Pseudomonas sp. TaxID=306 RepID=UPI003F3AF329